MQLDQRWKFSALPVQLHMLDPGHCGIASIIDVVFCCPGVPKGAMLTHGNLVADSAGMIRATYVAPGIVQTAYGTEESVPGKLAGCMRFPGAPPKRFNATQDTASSRE